MFTYSNGNFAISWFMLIVIVFMILFFIRMIRGKKSGSKVDQIDHGEIKPVAISKILKMKKESVIPTLRLSGVILASSDGSMPLSNHVTYGDLFAKRLMMLAKSDSSAAIVVEINTPGGSPVGAECIREAIARAQEIKPVFVFVSEISASGGMWAMSTANDITAIPGSILGSVGVISATLMKYTGIKKMTGFLGKGVEADSIEGKLMSSGSGKGLGHPFAEADSAAEKRMQEWLDVTRDDFVDLVASRSGVNRVLLEEQGASVYGTAKAKEIGVIDRVLSRFDFDAYVAENLNKSVENLNFISVKRATGGTIKRFLGINFDLLPNVFGIQQDSDPLVQLRKQPVLMMRPEYLDD